MEDHVSLANLILNVNGQIDKAEEDCQVGTTMSVLETRVVSHTEKNA